MESFKDFETDITWFKDDESIESYDNLDEVNSWDNDSIRKFITLGYEYAGDVLKKSAYLNNEQVNLETPLKEGDILTFLIKEKIDVIPSKEILAFPGSLLIKCPFIFICGIFFWTSYIYKFLNPINFSEYNSILFVAISIALPSPTIPATFSVPALNPFSWCPPFISGFIFVPFFTYNAPTPFGP